MAIAPRPDGSQRFPAQQGDLVRGVPHLAVTKRPTSTFLDQSTSDRRTPYRFGDSSALPDGGEGATLTRCEVIVRAEVGLGLLITQDCELDKQRPTLVFARVRAIPDQEQESVRENLRSRLVYRSFYLPRTDDPARLPEMVVDFGRLTTVLPEAFTPADRLVSLADDVRACLAADYMLYLFAEREEGR